LWSIKRVESYKVTISIGREFNQKNYLVSTLFFSKSKKGLLIPLLAAHFI